MTVRPIFAWYDLWIGAFWDAGKRRLYVFPIPMFGVVIQFATKETPMTDTEITALAERLEAKARRHHALTPPAPAPKENDR